MADEPTEGAEGVVDPNAAPAEVVADQPEVVEEAAPTIDEIASEMGWVPKDQFKGDPEAWKPAVQFIRDGKDIQRQQSRDLRELRSTVDNIARTSASLFQERLAAAKAELERKYDAAVEEGDPALARQIGDQINEINQKAQPTTPAVSDVTKEWVAKNPWMDRDPLAAQLAVDTCNKFAHLPVPKQLELAEREVRRAYPEHFTAQKPPPGVNQPDNRSANRPKGPKGFNEMPREAQAIAKDLVERKLIPSVDNYVKNYWATEGQAQ